ncbi:hypothetical protein J3R30DRAFT_3706325 [Lentinula aciculospora]|uniref:Nucleolar pre-ribosomal-associated protein 1 n=1 Tax=Lentinula aciculospora TaxID=153920 RepID=A0A9W9A7Q6_9AGAR|nr:hypothetical protein J3R30DRAFT_3706325 [Lentinula aciculospora]
MSVGPSQRKWYKADGSKNSKDPDLSFQTLAEIDRALAGNVDAVIRALSSLQWQFQHPGAHQNDLKQWLKSTSADALLHLWDQLESEGAYGKVLSTLIALLCTILRHLYASADGDNRLARTLLSSERMAKLNEYIAGKNLNRNGSSSQNANLVMETLDLLTALAAWDPKTVLESTRWDIEAFPRILRGHRNRKEGKGKGKEKSRSHADLRSRASLLSLVIAMLSQDVPARVKSAFLTPGTPTLFLLQNVLAGIGDLYNEENYTYSYAQIKDLLETLYAGVWCDRRVTKSVKIAVFAFGQGPKAGSGMKRGGQVAGEKVWKGLLSLYAREEHESSLPNIVEEEQAQDDEGGIPADLIHHFLLAICTRPGQALCFRDQGWYPPVYINKTSIEDDHYSPNHNDDEAHSNFNILHLSFPPNEETQKSSRYTIYNPLLLRVLRLLTPNTDPRQQELAARILEACPELVASCPDVVSGGPGALDPKLNARWMIGMAWYGRVVGLTVPEETFYMSATGGASTTRTPRLDPPPIRNVVESVIPSFNGGGTKSLLTKALATGSGVQNRSHQESSTEQNAGLGLGLVQHTTALTLCRCLIKFTQVRKAFLLAARAAGESGEDAEVDVSTVGNLKSTMGPWTRRLAEVTREVRARLPDIQFVLAFLKRIGVAALPPLVPLPNAPSTGTVNSAALALLSESAHRLVWLYHACFVSALTLSMVEEGLGRFDVGGLMANLGMFSAEESDVRNVNSEANSAAGGFLGLEMLKDVHIVRTLRSSSDFSSRIFGNLRQTPFHHLLLAFVGNSASYNGRKIGHVVLRHEIRRLLEQVLSTSLLFRPHEGINDRYRGGAEEEVRVWLAALLKTRSYNEVDAVVIFLDDCVQRCLRTPERYLDALEEVCDANMSDTNRWHNETTSSGLPSPLLMTLLEQLDHRIHAISIQEQQDSSKSVLSSLNPLLFFIKGLFVRLAALCEPRALPVLRALAEKITTGKNFDASTQSEVKSIARAEISQLRMLLEFNHSQSKMSGIDDTTMDSDIDGQDRTEDFEMLFVERSSVTNLADPVWRSRLAGRVIRYGGVTAEEVSAANLRAVRLVSHSLENLHGDTGLLMNSLILLLAELMTKLCEFNELSFPVKGLVKEYVFRENEVFKEFWVREECRNAREAIDQFLSSSKLKVGEVADRALLAEITEHWASYLRMQLQNSASPSHPGEANPQFALALLWLRFAQPHVLLNLFDLAYSCRSQSESSATAMVLISTTVEALGGQVILTSDAQSYSDVEPLSVEVELRRRLSVFLTLFTENKHNSAYSPMLEKLILYALQSRLPVGYNGFLSNPPVGSIHYRRRHHWNQRLENIQDMPNSDVFRQHYFADSDTVIWSNTTAQVVCSAIYSGCIEPGALSSWLIRSSRVLPHDISHMQEDLIPVLHAHLDCVHISGALSRMDEDRREEFWQACGAHFSLLINLASHAAPTLSAEMRMMCCISIGTLLDLMVAYPPHHGTKLAPLLIKHVQTLPMEELSSELLAIGEKCISSPLQGFNNVGEAVVDHALQWTVRMLTGCREIGDNDMRLLSELISLLAAKSRIKSHLAEPVLTAIPLIVNRHLQMLVQHPEFGKPISPPAKRALINVLYTLFHLHPFNTCQPSHVQPLLPLYRGSASVADRKLLAVFRLFEAQRRTSVASLLAGWTPLSEGFQSTSAFVALRDVDSLLVLRTALHFPQWRAFENNENWEERPESSEIYDPVFLLLLFAQVLVEDTPKSTTSWVEFFRTNIVSLAIRALSAKDPLLRELAAAQIGVLWECLEHAEMLEKPHVFHILSLLRDALRPVHGHTPERLPSYTTLLLAHALRGVFYPSNFVYPITARFLLQRPTLDISDVPLLFGMLYSSAEDHGKKDRAWIIRMLADGMQSSADWRVFKRRHTWDLLASVFQSEEKERALRRGVLEVLANLTSIPEAVMSLLLKSNLLAWIEMQLITPQEEEGLAWLKILENILVVSHPDKMEVATGGEWRACLVRCLLLLLDACKSVHTFPVFDLITGIMLRIALLSGSSPSQMSKLLTRCISVIKDQERNGTLLSAAPSSLSFSGQLFEAPHSAFKLFEVPTLSVGALYEAQCESVEQLWRVAMLVDVGQKLPAWDELTSLLLILRAHKGKHSIVGEWLDRLDYPFIHFPSTTMYVRSPTFLTLPDGARIAYELLGSELIGRSEPLVLIGGVSSTREDWQRLSQPLSSRRPVLIFDHRGIGDSSSLAKDDEITIELLARDLLFLLQHLKFSELALCGFSMGGTVTQQLLLLPYLTINPVILPFKITHVFLAGTFHTMWKEKGYGLRLDRTPVTGPLTDEEKKVRARPNLERSFDPGWVSDPANQSRFNWWLDRQIVGRSLRTIIKQSRAVAHMKLSGHDQIPKSTLFLIIHGEKDAVVPFSSAAKLLRVIPQALFIQTGSQPEQIPNLAFGHHWWEYFDIEVWVNVVEVFLASNEIQRHGKL